MARARRQLRRSLVVAARGDLSRAAGGAKAAVVVLSRESGLPWGPLVVEVVAALRDVAEIELTRVDLTAAVGALDDAVALLADPGWSAVGQDPHGWRCDLLTRRGNAQRLRGRHEAANADLAAALAGADDPIARGGVCNALGILAKDSGDYDSAERWYTEAQTLLGEHADPATCTTLLHNLAGLNYARGRFAEGERQIRRALDLRASAKSRDERAAILWDRGVLAALLAGQGRGDEAERLWAALVEDWSGLRGGEHYEVGHARHHLGLMLAVRGNAEAGAVELERALRVLRSVLGDSHPEVAALVVDLARVAGPPPRG